MTLYERIEHFILASMAQDDPTTVEEIVDSMSPSQLLCEISDALEHAGVVFNTEF